jgi:Ca2+-binding EF-hand superfamily protein
VTGRGILATTITFADSLKIVRYLICPAGVESTKGLNGPPPARGFIEIEPRRCTSRCQLQTGKFVSGVLGFHGHRQRGLVVKKTVAIFTLVLSTGLIGRGLAEDKAGAEKQPSELFKKLDTNGDGSLTASEVPKEHQKLFERLLRIGDANKDGKLSREEFDAVIGKTEKPVTDIGQTPGVNPGTGKGKAKADPKQLFARLDKNKDGKLTSDEVESRPRIKALFDRQGKESMTVDELTTALQNPGSKPNKKKLAKKASKQAAKQAAAGKTPASTPMAENDKAADATGLPEFASLLDTNHDGRLSREELSKAAEMFDRLDVNHDGVLDAKELTKLPAATSTKAATTTATPVSEAASKDSKHGKKHGKGAGAGANLTKLFQKADKDGDGKLTMEEAPRGVKKHFAKIDTNSDGFVDKSELEAWFRGHHHKKMAGKTPEATTPDKDSAQAG